MTRRTHWMIVAAMFAIGAVVRANNAWVFSPVRAYDGFAHFSYIWFLAENWWIPLPTSAWQFFQPPLYYLGMAAAWDALAGVDPIVRLKAGTMVVALAGLVHAWAAHAIVRRIVPGDRLAAVVAAGGMLFLPVHLYSAGFLGNEYLGAVFCTLTLLAFLRALDRPGVARSLWLGLCMGGAMMTKFTGIVVVAGVFGTLALRMLANRRWRTEVFVASLAATMLLATSGWFYGRNVVLYGNPFQMSRETFVLQRYERIQTTGRRNVWEYVLFDPLILWRPQWPRGVPLAQEVPVPYERSAMRESVLTGLYANTWFDGYGGWVLPSVTYDNTVRRAGQALLTIGLLPTALIVAGFFHAVRKLLRRGWDDTLALMVTSFAAMGAVVVHGTSSVPVHAAVKATYLLPVTAVFGVWLGLGVDWLRERRPRAMSVAVAGCAFAALLSVGVFFQGRTIATYWFDDVEQSPLWTNVYGVLHHAAGDRETARAYFQDAADDGYHLGWENLAAMALDDGEPLQAAFYWKRAMQLQPGQSLGTPADQQTFNRITAAEYMNSMAVAWDALGEESAALDAADRALAADPTIPEAAYDLAVLAAKNAMAGPASKDPAARAAWMQRSRRLLFDTLVMDPAFTEARVLAATLAAADGLCDEAEAGLAAVADAPTRRLYPVDTGMGDMLAASIKRRRHITLLPEQLTAPFQMARCRSAAIATSRAVAAEGHEAGSAANGS